MSKLRIGVIGAGAIAGSHLPQLCRRRDEVELVAIADISPARAELAAKYSIPKVVSDYQAILDDVDAVLICTPTHLHAPMAVEALRRGKAVFCEKPLARTIEQADAILAAQRQSGAPLQVGFVRRFDSEWLAWRQAVLADRIGRPVVWRDTAAGTGPAGKWFFDDAQGGGPFLDACIHSLDFGLCTFGPIASVYCNGRTMRGDSTAIDTGSAIVKFAGGDELLLAWSWGLPAGCRGTRVFEFLGPRGLISWPGDDPKDALSDDSSSPRAKSRDEEIRFPADALTSAYDRQMDQFIDVALGRKTPNVGGKEGRAALVAALAILESARSGQVVPLAQM